MQPHQPPKQESQHTKHDLFKCCFPTVFGHQSKSDSLANQIFKSMIDYIDCDQNKDEDHLFPDNKEREIIKNLLTIGQNKSKQSGKEKSKQSENKKQKQSEKNKPTASKLEVIFFCEYTCAVLLSKKQKESPIHIRIVYPEQWSSGTHDWRQSKLRFREPKKSASHFIKIFNANDQPLEDFAKKFQEKLKNKINKVGAQNKTEQSAKIVEQACLKVRLDIDEDGKKIENENEENQDQGETQEEGQSYKKKFKGSCQSINLYELKVNTAWYVPEAVCSALIKSNEKYAKFSDRFIIGFKAHMLEKAINEAIPQPYDQYKVANFKKCFDEVIFRYRENISLLYAKANDAAIFQKLMNRIQENIHKIKNVGLTSSIPQVPEDPQGLIFLKLKRPSLLIPEKANFKAKQAKNVDIEEYPLSVDSRLPFQQLLELYDQIYAKNSKKDERRNAEGRWILLVEKIFFDYAVRLGIPDDIIDLGIHMREIQCEKDASNLCLVVEKYQKLMKETYNNQKHFGLQMIGQAMSHAELIKHIAGIIAFESVKMNREKRSSNLGNYRVPLDIDKLYKQFISNSYQARRAMKSLKSYNFSRKNKKPIFILDGKNDSFKEVGEIIAKDTRSAHFWEKRVSRLMDLERKQIMFKDDLKLDSQYIESFNDDPWLFAFVQNIPSDILGMIKLLMFAQNPVKKDEGEKLLTNNYIASPFAQEKFSIVGYSYQQINHFNTFGGVGFQKNSNLKILFENCQIGKPFEDDQFQYYQKCFTHRVKQEQKPGINNFLSQIGNQSDYEFFYRTPLDKQTKREHELYSKKHLNPIKPGKKFQEEIKLEHFLALGNVRSAEKTQLMVLCLNIMQKKISANVYDQNCRLAEETFLQTVGQLSTYDKETQKHFKQIRRFIKNLIQNWAFTDINFCPILGPFLGYISQQLIDQDVFEEGEKEILKNITYQICKKCVQQLQRCAKELKEDSTLKVHWDQRFICMAAISCFRQTKLEPEADEDKLMQLCELIFQLRIYKILSNQEERPKNKRPFEDQLEFSVQKTILANISSISTVLEKHPDRISALIKKIDPSYPEDIVWARDNIFSISGKSDEGKDNYQIDLYTGRVFKNGKQMSTLSDKIKGNRYFRKIFGERDFQVLQSPNFYYQRTKDNMNAQFKIPEEKGLIFFQFSEDGKYIRHIYKKEGEASNKEDIWRLIPNEDLEKADCIIPKLFRDHYLAWYSEKRKIIIFRKTDFNEMYNIGMILHVKLGKQRGQPPLFNKSYYVTYHGSYENQDLNDMCDIENKKFDQIILRDKSVPLKQVRHFAVFSKFEDPEYILELKNSKTGDIQYLLHRYQIRFKYEDQIRLASLTYFGYCLDFSYYENSSIIFNRFSCLVLKKYSSSPALLNNHNRVVLITQGKIIKGGVIEKTDRADAHINCFKYDIHDFFGDLRGMTRQSVFHLANLMLAINDNIKISSIEMTPEEYCGYLLRSCFSNRPFNKNEARIIENMMIKQSQFYPSEFIALLCEGLSKSAGILSDILPFQPKRSKISQPTNEQGFNPMKKIKDQLVLCKTLYEKKYQQNVLSYRHKIFKNMLDYVGVKIDRKDENSDSQQINEDDDQDYNIYWRKLSRFRGKDIVTDLEEITKMFTDFETRQEELNLLKYATEKKNLEAEWKFPESISKLNQGPQQSVMMKELIDDLKGSYATFLQDEGTVETIVEKLGGEEKLKIINLTNELIENCQNCLTKLEHSFEKIKEENKIHPDVLTGLRPTLSYLSFTKLLCFKAQIRQFFPDISKQAKEAIKKMISYWLSLKTRLVSLERIQILLKAQKLDIVSLMREIMSPRKIIQQKDHWLAFEVENKLQLWSEQIDTYNQLMDKRQKGPFCQLNMGEGKTQVIIPMMILDVIFANDEEEDEQKKQLPRINLLSSLMDESRGNFFRFISTTGFQIPCFELPFDRSVNLNKASIFKARNLIRSFSSRLYIIMTRESRLSEVLRFYESSKVDNKITMRNLPIFPCKVFDIFDEIDALMTPIKSYIYSIGETEELPESKIRLQLIRTIIEIFLEKHLKKCLEQNLISTDQTDQDALLMVQNGKYPPGLRLNVQDCSEQKLTAFKKDLTKDILLDPKSHYFAFIRDINDKDLHDLIEFITNPLNPHAKINKKYSENAKNQLYLLRGAMGYNIFEHCLSMRCGVEYGVPDKYHNKRIAVPYDAADIPSRTSEYQQPDVSTILSYFAYYTRTLTQQQFLQTLQGLANLSKTSKQIEYQEWFKLLKKEDQQNLKIKNANQINFNSKAQRDQLFKLFNSNRRTISFWLNMFVFPKDLKQYKKSICSSAWDLVSTNSKFVNSSVGFSGTKDNHWLFSNKLTWSPCESPSIKGTDGKMLFLIAKYTIGIQLIEQNEKVLWQRFVDMSLKNKVGCIIDAGALCVGKSLQNQIVPWIAEHDEFDKNEYQGILFCDATGKWKIYDIQSKHYIPRGTTIPDYKTFVLFDEARTRGADIKMNSEVVASISLGPKMSKDKFMQAAGRLRKLGRDQKLIIMGTEEIFGSFEGFPKEPEKIKQKIEKMGIKEVSNIILAWCCCHSIQSNEKLLLQFANLGWSHINLKNNSSSYEVDLNTTLKGMYEFSLEKKSILEISLTIEDKFKKINPEILKSEEGKYIFSILKKYGKNVYKDAGALDDVCEREVETETTRQIEQQTLENITLQPVSESKDTKFVSLPQIFKDIPLKLCEKLKISENFLRTTKAKDAKDVSRSPQLGDIYFVLYDQQSLDVISLRQASIFINDHIINKKPTSKNIQILYNLQIENELIEKYELEQALVSAKFLAGIENYTRKEEDYLVKILLQNRFNKQQWKNNYEQLATIFLKKKKVYLDRFLGSTLEKIIIRLSNESTN